MAVTEVQEAGLQPLVDQHVPNDLLTGDEYLSSLGDGAQGSVTEDSQLSSGTVVFSTGQLSEFLFMGAPPGAIDGNDVKNVAQTVAGKIDAVLGG